MTAQIYQSLGEANIIYKVMRTDTSAPVPNVKVVISADAAGQTVVWNGKTNESGLAVDENGKLPTMGQGTWYVWSNESNFTMEIKV